MAVKQVWKGVFMYQRECAIRYAHAFSAQQAKVIMIRRLADEHGIDPRVVFGYFRDHPQGVTIQIEVEVKEIET